MSLFITTFFLLYGLLHFYALVKIRCAFSLGAITTSLLSLLMVAMIVAPVGVRLSEKAGFEIVARTIAHVGYAWMGVVFIFFMSGLLTDLYRLILHIANTVFDGALSRLALSYRQYVCLALLTTVVVASYAYVEALRIRTEHVTVVTRKLPPHVKSVRIVQVSDVHLGLIVREARLLRILETVRAASPDIFVSTGDLVDGQINNLETLIAPLRSIAPRYGKFAVTGNHEFYAGLPQSLEFTQRSGFTLLRDATVRVGDLLTITGIDDPASGGFRKSDGSKERALLSSLPQDAFRVLLKHRPDVETASSAPFDLQLSGHVHRGQIFPFFLVVRLFYPYVGGSHRVGGDALLHVNRGSGTWGPPMRFLAPPEVTVIDIVRGEREGD